MKTHAIDANQRKLLAFGVVLMLAVFLVGYYIFIKSFNGVTNKTVYLKDSKLYVFDDIYTLDKYQDKIRMHYPYFLVIEANKPQTTIYNLETMKKETVIHDILLDYYQGDIVYNKTETFFNSINLGKYCETAFIKNKKEVLCIKKETTDSIDNFLISINPDKPNLWITVYESKNLLTAISIIHSDLYIGEIDRKTNQSYVIKNKMSIITPNIISLIYFMEDTVSIYSQQSALNKNTASSYEFKNGRFNKINSDRIYFYR